VAEGVHAPLGVGRIRRKRCEDDSGSAERDRERPGPVDADAERAGRLVTGSGRHWNALAGSP
jgi:hypothetical protein